MNNKTSLFDYREANVVENALSEMRRKYTMEYLTLVAVHKFEQNRFRERIENPRHRETPRLQKMRENLINDRRKIVSLRREILILEDIEKTVRNHKKTLDFNTYDYSKYDRSQRVVKLG